MHALHTAVNTLHSCTCILGIQSDKASFAMVVVEIELILIINNEMKENLVCND